MYYLISIAFCMFLFAFINYISKNKKPFKRALINMFCGLLSLVAVNVAGIFIDVGLAVSPFSIAVSMCAGVPGVAAMLMINTFL